MIAVTHDILISTGDEISRPLKESNIVIGNNCWIGSNVFIKEGVVIGDDSIVGANSVVTKCFDSGSIIAGVPAKLIKKKDEIRYANNKYK